MSTFYTRSQIFLTRTSLCVKFYQSVVFYLKHPLLLCSKIINEYVKSRFIFFSVFWMNYYHFKLISIFVQVAFDSFYSINVTCAFDGN